MSNLKDAVSASSAIKTPEKKVFKFDCQSRSWRMTFTGWDGTERTMEFEFEKSLYAKSVHLIETTMNNRLKIGVYMVTEDGTRGNIVTTIIVSFPNLWPDRDPHQSFTINEMYRLYEVMMREAHNVWFQRLADGWRNFVCETTGALDFNVEFKKDPKHVD